MTTLRMRVADTELSTPTIRRVLLEPINATALPGFSAGAHIGVRIPIDGKSHRRAYSLVNSTGPADRYEIAVQLEPASSGGSRWIHSLQPGAEVEIEPPRNDFALSDAASHTLLIAGGIGITPILSMARQLTAQSAPFTLHYAARDAASMAYRNEVLAMPTATCWLDGGDRLKGIPLERIIEALQPGAAHLYVCGPAGLIQAVHDTACRLGWPDDHVHSELFSAPAGDPNPASVFEVELASSGAVFEVPPGQTILDVMIDAGLDPLFDCRRGDCGVCVTRVVEGEPDHRDICLSADERRDGQFCPCVSRARSKRIVLDL
jgi:ferredoxin-NADP reductase